MEAGPSGRVTDDVLLMLVQATTGGRSWDDNPGTGMSISNGLLYVTQTSRVHREIEDLLGRIPY